MWVQPMFSGITRYWWPSIPGVQHLDPTESEKSQTFVQLILESVPLDLGRLAAFTKARAAIVMETMEFITCYSQQWLGLFVYHKNCFTDKIHPYWW